MALHQCRNSIQTTGRSFCCLSAALITRYYGFSYALNACRGGFTSLIVAIYHPRWFATENQFMQEHLFQPLQLVESRFPDCALIVVGNLNRLDMKQVERHFRLKQIIQIPTRKDAILDGVLANLHRFYDALQGFAPFGLSDHNTITVEAKVRDNCRKQCRYVFKRDKWESRRAELGRYLFAIDWKMLFSSANCCQDMLRPGHNQNWICDFLSSD